MKLIQYDNINDFILHNEKLLLERESFHNLILGLAYSIRDKKLEVNSPLYYSVLDEHNQVTASALRSNEERPLIVTEMPPTAVDLLLSDLKKSKTNLKAVVGEELTATYFRDQWTKLNNLNFKILIHLGVYECYKIILPNEILGDLIEASIEHKTILMEYIAAFQRDCFPQNPVDLENVEKLMMRHLENKSIYFLIINKEIVSMAANVRSTLNGGTISLVYTPPKLRGNGYGSSVVALLAL